MQRRERQRRLDLEPLRAQHQRLPAWRDERVEEGGLADARLAAHHHDCRPSRAAPLEERGQARRSRARGRLARCDGTTARPGALRTRHFDRGDPSPEADEAGSRYSAEHRPSAGSPTTPGGTRCSTHPDDQSDAPGIGRPRHIGLLLFDGVEELDAVGPWEVLAYWTQVYPEDGWAVSCLSADGAAVIGAKGLVLGAHHSFDDAPA